MTITAASRLAGPFTGNDLNITFPFAFKTLAKEHLQVTRTTADVQVALTLDVDYSVALNVDQDAMPGGTLTYPLSGARLSAADQLLIVGAVPYDQPTDLPDGGNYRAATVEGALDYLAMQIQQLAQIAGSGGGGGGGGGGGIDPYLLVMRADLLSTADATKGAGMVGYGKALAYPVGSAGAALQQQQAQTKALWHAIRTNQRDVHIMVLGDSTGNATDEWAYLMAQWLAAQCPTHTVKYRLWGSGDGSTQVWGAYSTLQTGTGPALPYSGTPFTIHIDNCSVSGVNTFYTMSAREHLVWEAGRDYDLLITNYGHNLGTGQLENIALPEWISAAAYWRQKCPRAGMLITLQNPRQSSTSDVNTNGSAASARMVAAWRTCADLFGAGVVDVFTAFNTHPDYASLMADETHPNATGSALWLEQVKAAMVEPRDLTGPAPAWLNPLSESKPNFAPNPWFAKWGGGLPLGWKFTSTTAAKDTGRTEGQLFSLKLTPNAGLNPYIEADLTGLLVHLRGKTITMCARVWVPTTMNLIAGRIGLVSSDGATSNSFTSYPRGNPSRGGWEWVIATLTVRPQDTSLRALMYTGAADGSDNGKEMHVGQIVICEGFFPSVLATEAQAAMQISDLYAPTNVGKISTTSAGSTLTVSGPNITLSGATSPNSGVYINLPGLVPGKQYTFSWSAGAMTGNTQGGMYFRNGFNGGSVTFDSVATWNQNATGYYTFTAPAGPVSIWIYGFTGATGWIMNSCAIQPATRNQLALMSGRTDTGLTMTASAIVGGFGISYFVGGEVTLIGENALGNTKTSAVSWEVTLHDDYEAGANLVVVVNAKHAGGGAAGTRTLDVQAHKVATAGSLGSDLGPAAQNISGANTLYFFTITGATLAPRDRLLIRAVMTLQETGGATPMNSVLSYVGFL